ncbi:MAG: hypothetical protein IPH28_09845 [Cytophagaceae bacterium]|nr:hypothetical protein [Cytophagaceae bacterium]MBK9933259.1 hypothetical protein [Cytophagaceae bacterium]MBL0303026.1 hypothetical protein [Cytophagaceae bacterium]
MNSVWPAIVSKASDYSYLSASNYIRNEGIDFVFGAVLPEIDFTKNELIKFNGMDGDYFQHQRPQIVPSMRES